MQLVPRRRLTTESDLVLWSVWAGIFSDEYGQPANFILKLFIAPKSSSDSLPWAVSVTEDSVSVSGSLPVLQTESTLAISS